MTCHVAGDIVTSRMHIITSQHSFKFKRIHIPSVISINKSQGQSMKTAEPDLQNQWTKYICCPRNQRTCSF